MMSSKYPQFQYWHYSNYGKPFWDKASGTSTISRWIFAFDFKYGSRWSGRVNSGRRGRHRNSYLYAIILLDNFYLTIDTVILDAWQLLYLIASKPLDDFVAQSLFENEATFKFLIYGLSGYKICNFLSLFT